jgi:hypothetical protein
MLEKFETRKLTGAISLTLSNKEKWVKDKNELCNEILSILSDYADQGYTLTLRQLYYQLVAGGNIRNDDVVYKKMSSILDDLRYSGNVDWEAIEDRGRVPYLPFAVDSVAEALDVIVRSFKLDRQKGQSNLIEVWTEKDAISGILKKVTSEYHVNLVVNKGYSSSSAMHKAYERFAEVLNDGRNVKVLYFGDHDPSGLDMLRDIKERILFFIVKGEQVDAMDSDDEDFTEFYRDYRNNNDLFGVDDGLSTQLYGKYWDSVKAHYWSTRFEVIPIGLTMTQIDTYNPPPNPAKISDPRAAWYIKEFGAISWEVDALRPDLMEKLVEAYIRSNIDLETYNEVLSEENKGYNELKAFRDKKAKK